MARKARNPDVYVSWVNPDEDYCIAEYCDLDDLRSCKEASSENKVVPNEVQTRMEK